MWPQAAVPDPNAPQVRWCPKCAQAAVLLVFEWQQTSGSSTKDYRCQNCGAKYCVRPRAETIATLVVGVMAATTIIGLPFFFFYWRRHKVASRIPVVPMAPVPPLRFVSGPDKRACADCSAAATVAKVTRTTHNGVPAGTEYVYRCDGCRTQFTIQSIWGIVLGALLGLFVGGGAAWAFFAFAETPGWRWGGGGVCAGIAVLLVGQSISQWRDRMRHAVVDTPLMG